MAQSGGTNHMHCVFVETNIETRLGLLLHDQDDVSTLKKKICEEHIRCFPSNGDIRISALKVNRSGQFYHLADSVILTKAFEGNDKLIHVDVLCVKDNGQAGTSNTQFLDSKPYVPNLERCLTKQVADKKTKKRKSKSLVSEKISRKKHKVDPNEVQSLAIGKDIESGEGNGNKLGEKQQICDLDHKEPVGVEANQDLVGAMKQDLNVGVAIAPSAAATSDLVSIDKEKEDLVDDVNKIQEHESISGAIDEENEIGFKEDGAKDDDEAKSVKARKKSNPKKAKTVVVALVACDAHNVEADDNDVNKSQEDEVLSGEMEKDNLLTAETLKSTDAEKEGLKDHVDAESISIPSLRENEMGTKDNDEKDAADLKPMKARKKSKSNIAKTLVKENTLGAQNVEPDVVIKGSQEKNVERIVKRSSSRLKEKQVVEEA